jgi:hypothetical protein
MVEGYVGLPGYGKTYAMVSRALEVARRKGHQSEIFSNVPLVGIRFTLIESFEELVGCQNGTILLDELGVWMSSRDSMKLPKPVRDMLAQHRKNGLDLYWTAQHENRVDSIIRELTAICWRCRKLPYFGVITSGVDLFDADQKYGRRRWPWRQQVFDAYDTAYLVGDAKTGTAGQAGALRREIPPVPLRGCVRVIEDPYGSIVRWERTDLRRGILLRPG